MIEKKKSYEISILTSVSIFWLPVGKKPANLYKMLYRLQLYLKSCYFDTFFKLKKANASKFLKSIKFISNECQFSFRADQIC